MLKFRRSVGKVDNGSEGNNNDVVNNNSCIPAPSLDNRKPAMDNKNSRFGFNMNKAVNEFSMSQKVIIFFSLILLTQIIGFILSSNFERIFHSKF